MATVHSLSCHRDEYGTPAGGCQCLRHPLPGYQLPPPDAPAHGHPNFQAAVDTLPKYTCPHCAKQGTYLVDGTFCQSCGAAVYPTVLAYQPSVHASPLAQPIPAPDLTSGLYYCPNCGADSRGATVYLDCQANQCGTCTCVYGRTARNRTPPKSPYRDAR